MGRKGKGQKEGIGEGLEAASNDVDDTSNAGRGGRGGGKGRGKGGRGGRGEGGGGEGEMGGEGGGEREGSDLADGPLPSPGKIPVGAHGYDRMFIIYYSTPIYLI